MPANVEWYGNCKMAAGYGIIIAINSTSKVLKSFGFFVLAVVRGTRYLRLKAKVHRGQRAQTLPKAKLLPTRSGDPPSDWPPLFLRRRGKWDRVFWGEGGKKLNKGKTEEETPVGWRVETKEKEGVWRRCWERMIICETSIHKVASSVNDWLYVSWSKSPPSFNFQSPHKSSSIQLTHTDSPTISTSHLIDIIPHSLFFLM